MPKKHVERTLVILKPDAVQRGIVGEIMTRFERVGLKIIGMKMISPSTEQYYEHYENIGKMVTRRGERIFNFTLDFMSLGPVIAIVFEGIESIALVRKMVGTTEPKSADVGTIRGDYSHMSYEYADSNEKGIPNLIHASGDVSDAEQEIKHWFSESELFEYKNLNEKFTR